jgi:hypothetical protein
MTIEQKKRLNAIAKVATLSDQITKLIKEVNETQAEYNIYTENGIAEWCIDAAEEEFACLACLIGYEEDDEDVEAEDDDRE